MMILLRRYCCSDSCTSSTQELFPEVSLIADDDDVNEAALQNGAGMAVEMSSQAVVSVEGDPTSAVDGI